MGIKVNHYAAKTVVLNTQTNYLACVIEFSLGVVLTIMAMAGYKSSLLLLWLPCGLLAAACFFVVLYTIARNIFDFYTLKPMNKNKE